MADVVRLSKRAHLGVLVLTRLARATAPVSLRMIASNSEISAGYLEEIAAKLRNAGLIHAKRGTHGGYMLTKKPINISFTQIIEAIDGAVALTPCLAKNEKCFSSCTGRCSTKLVMRRAQDAFVTSLSKITLADIR